MIGMDFIQISIIHDNKCELIHMWEGSLEKLP
jgi:hypothetical protein